MTHDEIIITIQAITAPFPEARRMRDQVIDELNYRERKQQLMDERDVIIAELLKTLLLAVNTKLTWS